VGWKKLADELDLENRYTESDLLTKLAIDFSAIPINHPSQSGHYGIFRANLSKEVQRRLKDQLGQVGDDLGVKHYKDNMSQGDMIEENIAFIYLSRAINNLTDMSAPSTGSTLPLSAVITNRAMITQKMSGVHFNLNDDIEKKADLVTGMAIYKKLKEIGITWTDSHAKNYLVDANKLKALRQAWDIAGVEKRRDTFDKDHLDLFDLSTNAAIIDFGMMSVIRGTPASRELELFAKRVQQALNAKGELKNNSFLNNLYKTIGRVLE